MIWDLNKTFVILPMYIKKFLLGSIANHAPKKNGNSEMNTQATCLRQKKFYL